MYTVTWKDASDCENIFMRRESLLMCCQSISRHLSVVYQSKKWVTTCVQLKAKTSAQFKF